MTAYSDGAGAVSRDRLYLREQAKRAVSSLLPQALRQRAELSGVGCDGMDTVAVPETSE